MKKTVQWFVEVQMDDSPDTIFDNGVVPVEAKLSIELKTRESARKVVREMRADADEWGADLPPHKIVKVTTVSYGSSNSVIVDREVVR